MSMRFSAPAVAPFPRLDHETWRRLTQRGCAALRREFGRLGSLSPAQTRDAVIGVLPSTVATWLTDRLEALGWSNEARLPHDLLSAPSCPRDLAGAPRRLVELVLFGLPGQGRPADAKQRERLFQQLSAEIVREAREAKSLEVVVSRVLRNGEVQRDPVLQSMLEALIAERRSQLAADARPQQARPQVGFAPAARVEDRITPEEIHAIFDRIRHEFDDRLVRFDMAGAQVTLSRMDGLQKSHPRVLKETAIERARADMARVEQRRLELFAEVDALTVWAVSAAREGRHDEAAQALRRLSTIHASRPLLLSDAGFKEIRDRMASASRVHEDRIAAKVLLERERSVVAELRGLADSIRRFNEIARREPADSPAFVDALTDYRRTVQAVQTHDTEWLAALTLELDELLADLHDPTGKSERQVSHFLDNVHEALQKLRRNIAKVGNGDAPAA
jgi:hypothetical protein